MGSSIIQKAILKVAGKKDHTPVDGNGRNHDEINDDLNGDVNSGEMLVKKPQTSGQALFTKDAGPKPVDMQGLPHKLYLTPGHEGIVSDILYVLNNGTEMGHLKPTGFILSGPPGVGKTIIAKYAMLKYGEESKSPLELYAVSKEDPPQFISSIFKVAREHSKDGKPVVVLIDEIDTVGTKESSKFSGNGGPLSALLTELDGITGKGSNVFVIGATNYIDAVDFRLMRAGRFDKIYEVELPDVKSRKEMLKLHVKDKDGANPHKFDVSDEDIDYMAKRTFGYTPADLRSYLSTLFLYSGKKGVKKPVRSDIDSELKVFKPTLTRDMLDFCEPEITMDDLILNADFKNTILDYIQDEEANILLYGPKGCGKSVMTEAIAGSIGSRLVKANAAELQEGVVGESQKKIRKVFDRSRQLAPTVLGIDEIEGIVELRGMMSHKSDETSFINSYLSQPIPGVTVIASTNDPTRINDTTLSRFEPVYISLPTKEQVADYIKKNGLKELEGMALEGYSFRDLGRLGKSIKYARKRGIAQDKLMMTISGYQPENKTCDTDWKYVRECVGGGLI